METLLTENNETSIHQRYLQIFKTEIYQIKNDCAPPKMGCLFQFLENTFNLRSRYYNWKPQQCKLCKRNCDLQSSISLGKFTI